MSDAEPEGMPTMLGAFVRHHPAASYFALTFAISWGGLLAIAGPTGIVGSTEDFERLFPLALPFVALGPAISGLSMIWLSDGRRGLRELRARLFAWRVRVRWYALALLLAPVYFAAAALAASRHDPTLLPGVLTAADPTSFVLRGLAAALVAGIVEELGWTGFAVPTLRRRHAPLTTGLIVGALWGFWHFLPKIWGAAAHGMTPYLPLDLVAALVGLTGYRILMVWVYDRTRSLLIAILMHVGLTAATLVLQPQVIGEPLLLLGLLLSVIPWLIVAGVLVIRHRSAIRSRVRRHPVASYLALTFAISWGGILAIVGPSHILTAPEKFDSLTWVAPLVLGPCVSGIVMTAVVGGRRALRDYLARLFRWRVGARWIAIALLTGPAYMLLTTLALLAIAPIYVPAFITTNDLASLLMTGTIVALSAGLFEELGWTGFATPALRQRHSALATGLIVGVMWGLWHVLPEMLGAPALDYVAYLPLQLASVVFGLVGFRILMVWVFDHTRQSLLVGILMHTGLTASLMIIQPLVTGAALVTFGVVQAFVPWLIVAAVIMLRRVRRGDGTPTADRDRPPARSWAVGSRPSGGRA